MASPGDGRRKAAEPRRHRVGRVRAPEPDLRRAPEPTWPHRGRFPAWRRWRPGEPEGGCRPDAAGREHLRLRDEEGRRGSRCRQRCRHRSGPGRRTQHAHHPADRRAPWPGGCRRGWDGGGDRKGSPGRDRGARHRGARPRELLGRRSRQQGHPCCGDGALESPPGGAPSLPTGQPGRRPQPPRRDGCRPAGGGPPHRRPPAAHGPGAGGPGCNRGSRAHGRRDRRRGRRQPPGRRPRGGHPRGRWRAEAPAHYRTPGHRRALRHARPRGNGARAGARRHRARGSGSGSRASSARRRSRGARRCTGTGGSRARNPSPSGPGGDAPRAAAGIPPGRNTASSQGRRVHAPARAPRRRPPRQGREPGVRVQDHRRRQGLLRGGVRGIRRPAHGGGQGAARPEEEVAPAHEQATEARHPGRGQRDRREGQGGRGHRNPRGSRRRRGAGQASPGSSEPCGRRRQGRCCRTGEHDPSRSAGASSPGGRNSRPLYCRGKGANPRLRRAPPDEGSVWSRKATQVHAPPVPRGLGEGSAGCCRRDARCPLQRVRRARSCRAVAPLGCRAQARARRHERPRQRDRQDGQRAGHRAGVGRGLPGRLRWTGPGSGPVRPRQHGGRRLRCLARPDPIGPAGCPRRDGSYPRGARDHGPRGEALLGRGRRHPGSCAHHPPGDGPGLCWRCGHFLDERQPQ